MTTEEDDELKAILDEIESDPLPDSKILAAKPPQKKDKDTIDISVPMKVGRTKVNPLASNDVEDVAVDMKSMMGKYRAVFDEVVENCRSDRAQVQDVIDHFFDVVANAGKVPSVYIEKFPDLLKTKNDIAVTSIRAMDSFSKLISATKGSEIMNTVNLNFDPDSLEALLQAAEHEPEGEDD